MTDYNITVLDISNKGLTKLQDDIDKYTNLKELYCGDNKLTSLDNLPPTLEVLYCSNNKITSLDNLPPPLIELDCSYPLNDYRCYNT
jgi:Leucine-rich repeat (LRR) protein